MKYMSPIPILLAFQAGNLDTPWMAIVGFIISFVFFYVDFNMVKANIALDAVVKHEQDKIDQQVKKDQAEEVARKL